MSVPVGLPKLLGADVELGNFVLGRAAYEDSMKEASEAVLAEIGAAAGARMTALGSGVAHDDQDRSRIFFRTNGGCVYIDLDHLELCLPEVLSAFDHVACWHAMLRIARAGLNAANEKLPDRKRIQVLVNNTDGQGHSYGSHLNFLISRRAWDNIFRRKIHYMLYLAAFQASSIVYTGQGKVGSENDAPGVAFQISQRADFFERLMGLQTTHNRPLVNSRDES